MRGVCTRAVSTARRYPVPLAYLAALAWVSAVYVYALSPRARVSFVAWASTNLANLPSNPLGTLLVSAFLPENSQWAWLLLAAIGLFPVARRFGNTRTVLLAGGAHVVATAVSEGVAAWRLAAGAVHPSIRHLDDVGPSYVVAAALTAAVLYGPGRLPRALALAGWLALAPYLFQRLSALEVGAVGHVVAMVTGAAVGGAFALRGRRSGGDGRDGGQATVSRGRNSSA